MKSTSLAAFETAIESVLLAGGYAKVVQRRLSTASARSSPTCWIIAGPNGVGKTTFALEYLPQVAGCRHFINADLIGRWACAARAGARTVGRQPDLPARDRG